MATLLIRRRRPIGESMALRPLASGPRSTVAAELGGTAGAGRLCQLLGDLGVPLQDVTQLVIDPDAAIANLGAVDLGRRFAAVALGSHLVNTVDDDRRGTLVRLAARHVAAGDRLLMEHHPIDWATTAGPTPPMPGAQPGMTDVTRDGRLVSAVSVFDVGGRVIRQPFTARVLSEDELDASLESAGLRRVSRLSPTWIEAEPQR